MGNIKRLSNCQINIENVNATGILESIELPEIEYAQVEYDALGIVGTPELPANKINPMRTSMVFLHQPDTPEFSNLMHNPILTTQVILTADQPDFTNESLPVFQDYKCVMRVRPVTIMSGTFEGGEGTKPEHEFTVSYIEMTINGTQLYEIDINSPNGIKVNGNLIPLVGGSVT